MQRNSNLSISRPILKTEELVRATAKVQHYADTVLGDDQSAFVSDGEFKKPVGNPRFRILIPLEFSLLYRAGIADPRNKASRASNAEDALTRSKEFESNINTLKRSYDGLDFSRLSVSFTTAVLALKPGFVQKESQILLIPNPELIETGYLLEESQICSSGLIKAAPKFGAPGAPIIPGIPLIRLASDVTPQEKGQFIKNVMEHVLPLTLELGAWGIDSHNKSLGADEALR